jgi:hypothetical protein
VLAQWAADPLVVPVLPHLAIGAATAVVLWPVPGTSGQHDATARSRWPPAAVRTLRFWLTVALPAPVVFGSMSVTIAVLPEEVTSARTLSVGFAGLITALAFAAGTAVQPLARQLETRRRHAGIVRRPRLRGGGRCRQHPRGHLRGPSARRDSRGALGLAYGLCLASGLRQAEQLAGAHDRGAVVACYFAVSYVGFAAPYALDGLNSVLGRPDAFAAQAGGSGGTNRMDGHAGAPAAGAGAGQRGYRHCGRAAEVPRAVHLR